MDAAAFVDKWRKSRRSERSASKERFLENRMALRREGVIDPRAEARRWNSWKDHPSSGEPAALPAGS